MIENFKKRYSNSIENTLNVGILTQDGGLTNAEVERITRIRDEWNFYEGYHWEGIEDLGSSQVTFNYCRPFVNKFVSFEFGKGFTIKDNVTSDKIEVTVGDLIHAVRDDDLDGVIDDDEISSEQELREKTKLDYLFSVWKNNKREELLCEIGQTKSVTGDAWVKVQYLSSEDLDDPFEEYPNGRIRLTCVPTQFVFPDFDDHDKDKLISLTIMYPVRSTVDKGFLRKRTQETTSLYKEVWTREEIFVYQDGKEVESYENPYGIIPFVHIKNFPIAGRTYGVSDLDDVIPLNVELNTKRSDVSEVIDYHSAPITVVYGAKIGNLEKGANKVWGGLPKDSKVENLSLTGDLAASVRYTSDLKTAMCEIGGIPETVLGGASAISNTSGVALQYMNLPLIERTRIKRHFTAGGLQTINKMILFISLREGLIEKPDDMGMAEFLDNTVSLPDTLPKDELLELQKIETEMKLGLECRHGAMERVGKEDVENKLAEIDKERAEHPELFNPLLQQTWYQNNFNSGMTNGQTPIEQVRTEMTGQNGGVEE